LSDAPAPSARLAYEPLDVAHTPSLAAWADPELYRWIGDAPTLAELAARITRITTRPPPAGELWRNWVARRRDDAACVGVVEATVYDAHDAHLAYFVFAAFQRQGYAREACAGVISHLRAHYGVNAIVASVDTRNEPSQRLVESLGFVREDQRLPADPIRGEPAWDFRYRLVLRG
jgi:RimJ/RimL family protein N-acetyltransferase